jgi:hypothetical protein
MRITSPGCQAKGGGIAFIDPKCDPSIMDAFQQLVDGFTAPRLQYAVDHLTSNIPVNFADVASPIEKISHDA